MKRFRIISPLKVKDSFVREGQQEYLKRLKGKAKFELLELEIKKRSNETIPVTIEREGDAILNSLSESDFVIVLDQKGKLISSEEFSKLIFSIPKRISFVIGGADGLSEKVRKKASKVLSLSSITFPFQLVRLILIEQIYRAYSIEEGTPYHK